MVRNKKLFAILTLVCFMFTLMPVAAMAEGENVAGKSLFFLNENIAENFWIVNNRTYLKTIGKHSFYL